MWNEQYSFASFPLPLSHTYSHTHTLFLSLTPTKSGRPLKVTAKLFLLQFVCHKAYVTTFISLGAKLMGNNKQYTHQQQLSLSGEAIYVYIHLYTRTWCFSHIFWIHIPRQARKEVLPTQKHTIINLPPLLCLFTPLITVSLSICHGLGRDYGFLGLWGQDIWWPPCSSFLLNTLTQRRKKKNIKQPRSELDLYEYRLSRVLLNYSPIIPPTNPHFSFQLTIHPAISLMSMSEG